MKKYGHEDPVVNQAGVPVNSATVTVYLAGTSTLATLYSDDGVTSQANPLTTSALGEYFFFVEDGWYDITYSGGSPAITTETDTNVEIFDYKTKPLYAAHMFQGSDAGAKIVAAITALPATGGTVDARGLEGAQTISTNPFSGVTKPVTLLLGGSTITTVTLQIPGNVNLFRIIGSGKGQTILTPASANQAVIQGATSGAADGDYFSDFSVKAHASGSTGPAIELAGFRAATFEDIEYLKNGSAHFNSFFHFASYINGGSISCYNNNVIRPFVQEQNGPATVFLFDNGGSSSAANNANVALIESPQVYSNTGITTVIDARRSGSVTVNGGMIEANTGATVLIPGTHTRMQGVWLEGNATNAVTGGSGADGSSGYVTLMDNYTLSAQNWTLQSGAVGWLLLNNGDGVTIVDNSANSANIMFDSIYGALYQGMQTYGTIPVDFGGNALAIGTKFARSAYGGNIRFRDDTGTTRWGIGIEGSPAATNYIINDSANDKTPFSIVANTPTDTVILEAAGTVKIGGSLYPTTTGITLGSSTNQWRVYTQVIATASLPAADASMNGALIIEDAGAGDRNLIIYAGGQRFRIDGGVAF